MNRKQLPGRTNLRVCLIAAVSFAAISCAPQAIAGPTADTNTVTGGNVTVQRNAMSGLAFLHGRWRGINRTWDAQGRVTQTVSRDVIVPLLDGTLLSIQGMSYPQGADLTGKPDSQNFGILRFDDRAGILQVRAWFQGHEQLGEGRILGPGNAEWVLASPIGLVRFTVTRIDTDRWTELGELSADGGKTWTKRFEIDFAQREP